MFNLKTVIWNYRRLKNKRNELIRIITAYDIIVLVETKCQNNKKTYFSSFKTVYKKSRGNSGGVAMLIRKDIDFQIIKGGT